MTRQPAKFRAFFAIELTDELRLDVVKIIKQLKKQKEFTNIKWTEPENLHVTVRFLGNISKAQYKKIVVLVRKAVTEMEPFVINFTELIIFPSAEKPIAIALKPEPLAFLVKLNQLIEQAIADCEVESEVKAFLPHLTLGKIKTVKVPELAITNVPDLPMCVQKFRLFQSETDNNGSKYTPLVCFSW